jgi:hypothetical protein
LTYGAVPPASGPRSGVRRQARGHETGNPRRHGGRPPRLSRRSCARARP